MVYAVGGLTLLCFITGVRLGFSSLMERAPSVTAVVKIKTVRNGLGAIHSYYVDYSYPEGKIYIDDTDQVTKDTFDSLDIGENVSAHVVSVAGIHYSQLANVEDVRSWWSLWGIPIPFAMAAIYFYFADWVGSSDLVKYGEVVLGEITRIDPPSGWWRGWTVHYRFKPPRGDAMDGKMKFRPARFSPGDLKPGTRVTILYSVSNSRESIVYELSDFAAKRTSFDVVMKDRGT